MKIAAYRRPQSLREEPNDICFIRYARYRYDNKTFKNLDIYVVLVNAKKYNIFESGRLLSSAAV